MAFTCQKKNLKSQSAHLGKHTELIAVMYQEDDGKLHIDSLRLIAFRTPGVRGHRFGYIQKKITDERDNLMRYEVNPTTNSFSFQSMKMPPNRDDDDMDWDTTINLTLGDEVAPVMNPQQTTKVNMSEWKWIAVPHINFICSTHFECDYLIVCHNSDEYDQYCYCENITIKEAKRFLYQNTGAWSAIKRNRDREETPYERKVNGN